MSYRIAIASKDGKTVNKHFGMADSFLIFEIDENSGQTKYIENRATPAACAGDCCKASHEEKQFASVIEQLNDVSAIFVSKIGEGAANFVESKGKAVYEAPYPIENLIEKIVKDKIYEADQWQQI
jgi:predicted Fe-Mo cluster-binding NifX family protein